MFSIGENGDLYYDKSTRSMMDIVMGDLEETNFKTARTRIISHFKYRGYLENNFIKHYRNKFSNDEIKKMIDEQLNILFEDNLKLRNKITYVFKNNSEKFLICFLYKKNSKTNRNLLYYAIKI